MTSAFENVNRHFKEFLLLLSKSIQLPRASGKGVKYPIIQFLPSRSWAYSSELAWINEKCGERRSYTSLPAACFSGQTQIPDLSFKPSLAAFAEELRLLHSHQHSSSASSPGASGQSLWHPKGHRDSWPAPPKPCSDTASCERPTDVILWGTSPKFRNCGAFLKSK